jgi:Xaa-Pro aminopeptidase
MSQSTAEPGYYADGKFGIRIESIVVVRKVSTPNDFGSRGYLGFEHVTMSPIQTKLVDMSLLTQAERDWLNAYHEEVLAKVGPELAKVGDARAQAWLERECSSI